MAFTPDALDCFGDSSGIELIKFNDTLNCESGQTLTSTASYSYEYVKIDKGLAVSQYNLTGIYGTVPIIGTNPDNNLAVSAFMRMATRTGRDNPSISYSGTSLFPNDFIVYMKYSRDLYIEVNSGADLYRYISAVDEYNTDLIHVVINIDRTNGKAVYYIDKVKVYEQSFTTNSGVGTDDEIIFYGDNTGTFPNVLHDHYRLFNRVLTEPEIAELFDETPLVPPKYFTFKSKHTTGAKRHSFVHSEKKQSRSIKYFFVSKEEKELSTKAIQRLIT